MKKITIAILISIFFTPLNAKEVLFSDNDYIIIKDRVFIGSNTSLVAPITIDEQSVVGAGSVITKKVNKHWKIKLI